MHHGPRISSLVRSHTEGCPRCERGHLPSAGACLRRLERARAASNITRRSSKALIGRSTRPSCDHRDNGHRDRHSRPRRSDHGGAPSRPGCLARSHLFLLVSDPDRSTLLGLLRRHVHKWNTYEIFCHPGLCRKCSARRDLQWRQACFCSYRRPRLSSDLPFLNDTSKSKLKSLASDETHGKTHPMRFLNNSICCSGARETATYVTS